MFPGFYHGRRVPCTQKPSSRATLTLNSFRVRSRGFASLFVDNVSGFYRVNLLTGQAILIDTFEKAVIDIAIPLNQ